MTEEFECEECGRSFDTKRGLSSHRRQAHEGDEVDDRETARIKISLAGLPALASVLLVGIALGFVAGAASSGFSLDISSNSQSITDKVKGVSSDRVAELMNESRQEYMQELRKDIREAESAGISATPGFVIYSTGSSSGERIMGAQPYRNFQNAIERQKRGEGGNVSTSTFSTSNEPSIGSKDAPVTMVYWYDYQCPFCGRFEQRVYPQLKKNYVENGELRIVFKDHPFLGKDSRTAALASNAVWNEYPDRWIDWHNTVFDSQGKENSGWASRQNLVG
ncbi:MAG: thioredoxin domain-containing protein [Candidatus Nanohaloarchaea archaeon]